METMATTGLTSQGRMMTELVIPAEVTPKAGLMIVTTTAGLPSKVLLACSGALRGSGRGECGCKCGCIVVPLKSPGRVGVPVQVAVSLESPGRVGVPVHVAVSL
ncbi:hypothetical protein NDU88_013096 [Pleurodeles waltl]|uniref:Uncharacterized protein n=1 Tax=Pleurodeles waltl TaxID=8319 RepID=A0AAV7R7W3_PLEWA|nr:hypothetical protein NDU88_013096 [Pleurodeles waltl]